MTHLYGKLLSPRNLVHALEHSKVCNCLWVHMAHWQLAAVKRTGRAHPAGQLRPHLNKTNRHSSSVPFGHPSIWCRSDQGSLQLQRWAWECGVCQSGTDSHSVSLPAQGGLHTRCWEEGRLMPELLVSIFILLGSSFWSQVLTTEQSIPRSFFWNNFAEHPA